MADTPDVLGLLLNESSGTTATAYVGSNGTYARNTTNTFTSSTPGTALTGAQDFAAGSQDRVTISGVSFSSGSPFTFCGWMKFDAAISNRAFFGMDSATNTGRTMFSNGTSVTVTGTSGSSTYTVSVTTGVFYHVAVTRDSSNNVRVFIDAVESSTGAQTIAQTFAPTAVGRSNTAYHDGPICDFRVYSTAKNAAALTTIMAEKDSGGGGSANSRYYRTQQAMVV